MHVHKVLGDGFLESAYGDALEIEFLKRGIPYVREDDLRVFYEGVPLKTHYRADFTCYERQYIVELKALKALTKIEWAQVVHYMRATGTPYGLLINFGRPQLQYDTFDQASLPKIFNDVTGGSHDAAPLHFNPTQELNETRPTSAKRAEVLAEASLQAVGVKQI